MKKTTIIVICVVYMLSILAVQFFGIPVTVPEAGEYITSIEIVDVSLSNRQAGQDTEIEKVYDSNGNLLGYKFRFIEPEEGESYTDDEESLKANPNRIKITYKVLPEGVAQGALRIFANGSVCLDLEKPDEFSYEIAFLGETKSTIEIKEDKGSVSVRTQIKIQAKI